MAEVAAAAAWPISPVEGWSRSGMPNDRKLYRRMPRLLKPGQLEKLLDEERGER